MPAKKDVIPTTIVGFIFGKKEVSPATIRPIVLPTQITDMSHIVISFGISVFIARSKEC